MVGIIGRPFLENRYLDLISVVGKLEIDAKSRGRSVQIKFLRKVISQKSKKDADAKKLYYINGGTQV